jgi:hypothetical protein
LSVLGTFRRIRLKKNSGRTDDPAAATRPAKNYFLGGFVLMVSTTCVVGLLTAVLTVVKRPVTALRPIM